MVNIILESTDTPKAALPRQVMFSNELNQWGLCNRGVTPSDGVWLIVHTPSLRGRPITFAAKTCRAPITRVFSGARHQTEGAWNIYVLDKL